MHRKGENTWIIMSHSGSPIPLMNIEVNNEDALKVVMIYQMVCTYNDIIQNAEAFSAVIKGMMRSAGDVQ